MADISSNDEPLLELALFAGAGGGILGGKLLGWRTVCAVEINAYAASVLVARQNDGCLEPFPVWDDIRTFRSDNPDCSGMFAMLRGVRRRLVISGGFPCQDISVAGAGAGLDGERSGLWSEQARIIREIRPAYAFVENSPALIGRGLYRVLGDLATLGFDARWGVFSGLHVGAPIRRERIFITGTNQIYGETRLGIEQDRTKKILRGGLRKRPEFWLQAPPRSSGMVNGVGRYMDRVESIGNGQIPAVAATAWRILSGR